jgi:beta-lactam-binding protein with PASTA domain
MPSLVGTKLTSAEGVLRSDNLYYEVMDAGENTKGDLSTATVSGQSPSSGRSVDLYSQVTILVHGLPDERVPNVTNITSGAATSRLEKLGLKAVLVPIHKGRKSGFVDSQLPRGGVELVRGSEVVLNVVAPG